MLLIQLQLYSIKSGAADAQQEHQLFTNNYYKMTQWVDNVYVLHKNRW
jgi:hypothetical protein